MADVQLYDKDGSSIYPNTRDEITSSSAIAGLSNVKSALSYLKSSIDDLNKTLEDKIGDTEEVTNIVIDIKYTICTAPDEATLTNTPDLIWDINYREPTKEKPYAWKRTTISTKSEATNSISHELISKFTLPDKTLTIYASFASTESAKLELAYTKNENEEDVPDETVMNVDDYLPGPTFKNAGELEESVWSFTPKEISQSTPNVYIAIRTRTDGVWSHYEGPYLYSKWVYDSTIATMYCVTNSINVPQLNVNNADPNIKNGEVNQHDYTWVNTILSEFQGYLWMITGTKVNGNLVSINNSFWSEPTLISIVK